MGLHSADVVYTIQQSGVNVKFHEDNIIERILLLLAIVSYNHTEVKTVSLHGYISLTATSETGS